MILGKCDLFLINFFGRSQLFWKGFSSEFSRAEWRLVVSTYVEVKHTSTKLVAKLERTFKFTKTGWIFRRYFTVRQLKCSQFLGGCLRLQVKELLITFDTFGLPSDKSIIFRQTSFRKFRLLNPVKLITKLINLTKNRPKK